MQKTGPEKVRLYSKRRRGRVLKYLIGLIACTVLFLPGCNPKVWEVDAKLGVQVDSSAGFFAYYTPAPSVNPNDVRLYIASEDSILKSRVLQREGGAEILPIGVSATKRVILRPESLKRIIGAEEGKFNIGETSVEIGYIRKLIQPADYMDKIFQNGVEIAPDGWIWCEPTEKLEKKIRDKIEVCVSTAADYGAEAITDIVVFYTEVTSTAYGPAGTYIYGKAIVGVVE
jgi:hypothetical protein